MMLGNTFPAALKLGSSYQHINSPCLLPSSQRNPGSYPYTKEKNNGDNNRKTP